MSASSLYRIVGVHFASDLQARIDQLVIDTGRASEKLLEDAMTGCSVLPIHACGFLHKSAFCRPLSRLCLIPEDFGQRDRVPNIVGPPVLCCPHSFHRVVFQISD
jgi:hypothetical protein